LWPLQVLDVIHRCGFEKPFPVQCQAIPAIMSGRDCIGIAKTGSGKTLAFVLPMVSLVLKQQKVRLLLTLTHRAFYFRC
jgi:ATP-dependent RNA helicase DDX46/PRP5